MSVLDVGSYGPDPQQRVLLYAASDWSTSDVRPVVLFVHGGAWVAGLPEAVDRAVLSLVGDGYAVASVGYSLAVPVRTQVVQLRSAVSWVRDNASLLGVDPSRLVVAGHSAGAHLASMVALTWNDPLWVSGDADADPPAAVLAIAPPLDLTYPRYNPSLLGVTVQSLVALANGCQRDVCDIELLKDISPLYHADPDDPPMYLLVGGEDDLAPPMFADDVAKAYSTIEGYTTKVWVDLVEHADHSPSDGVNYPYLLEFLRRSLG
jgi:acetyl esterase/lipase